MGTRLCLRRPLPLRPVQGVFLLRPGLGGWSRGGKNAHANPLQFFFSLILAPSRGAGAGGLSPSRLHDAHHSTNARTVTALRVRLRLLAQPSHPATCVACSACAL
ncbi:hypothetical protein VFPFJ_04600 [Purpureocillium lilacinum]|uniref:Uncharacterized protein n=1 Tax=Purpureocillium lilacinum TaxID=33203 RepID=A0A179HLU7_PURLI|nr:hypothetical protein VFPFJ_04600 [Purpureocillium lilacinum]OAQ90440.1 hypothetical protein VFPFJ_04600 [Purpureocillium lilacinum]